MILSHPHEDGAAALGALADELNAPPAPVNVAVLATPALPKSGKLDAHAVMQVVAHYLPEDAILADEAVTSGLPYFDYTATCAPHDYLNLAGGAIGGEVLQLCSRDVIGWLDAPSRLFGLRSLQVAPI